MKPYQPQEVFQLMARYLVGESTPVESARLESMLAGDADLASEFEICRSIILQGCEPSELNEKVRGHLASVIKRLKEDRLM